MQIYVPLQGKAEQCFYGSYFLMLSQGNVTSHEIKV